MRILLLLYFRGRASLERLAELNVYVNVKLHEEAVDEKSNFEFLADFQVVIWVLNKSSY